MKALVMEEYKEFRYMDIQKPTPASNEVLIRVKACAVCGSDVHGMDGSTGRRRPRIIMGHEAAGIIEECGEDVMQYKPGDRVTFDSTIYCKECEACREGNINLCGKRRVMGVSCEEYRMDGAFAEYVAVPEYILYPLPDNISFEQAAMVEPLSVAYHAITRGRAPSGGFAAVVGAGTIGQLLIQVLKSMGAQVIAVDIDNEKLNFAEDAGADYCVNSMAEDAEKRILELTGNRGVDAAYDAVGISSSMNLCAKAAKLNGDIVLIGNLSPSVDFPLQWVVTRQQRLSGSCASSGEYGECLKLLGEGKVKVDKLISKVVPLSEGNQWMKRIYEKEPGLYKIIFVP